MTSSQQQGIVLQEAYFADRQVTTNDNVGYFVLPKGYFTYRSRSDTDVFVFNRNDILDKGIISYYYPVFQTKYTCSDFLLRRLNHGIRKQLAMAAEGTGQKVLAHSKFKNMTVSVPKIGEQQKIGTFFRQLDRLITLHQCNCNMATRPCEWSSGLRAIAWEQRKFEKIAIRSSAMAVCSRSLPGVEYEDIISEQGILNKDIKTKRAVKIGIKFLPGDVLFGKLRPYLKNWLLPDFTGVAVGDFWVLQPSEIDSQYLYYLIQTPAFQEVSNQSTGTKMPRADWNLVANSMFFLPQNDDEQTCIGTFFRQLDRLITLHQRKHILLT